MNVGSLLSEYMVESPPLLRDDRSQSFIGALNMAASVGDVNPMNTSRASLFIPAFESYMRRMLATCAPYVTIPAVLVKARGNDKRRLKQCLPPSARNRLTFVDGRCTLYKAVSHYFKLIESEVTEACARSGSHSSFLSVDIVQEVAWQFYRLVLTAKCGGQAAIPLAQMRIAIRGMLSLREIGSESKARLSVVSGVLSCLTRVDEIPGFTCRDGVNVVFTERISEILEDAYLIEASRLRLFFGIQPNIASLKRDLRKILTFIVRRRSWARRALGVALQAASFAKDPSELADAVLSIIPDVNTLRGPIILDSLDDSSSLNTMRAVAHVRGDGYGVSFFYPQRPLIPHAFSFLEKVADVNHYSPEHKLMLPNIGLDARSLRELQKNNIVSLEGLLQCSSDHLLSLNGIGTKTLQNISVSLLKHGLSLKKADSVGRGTGGATPPDV